MKKSLLAAALLAGFAGAAHAQSSVTLYGLVDAGFDWRKVDGQTIKGIDSGNMSQSRFGIRGSEDLGSGLKAIFDLENGFTTDNGQQTQNRLFGRYAYVGLDSDQYGRLTLGRTANLGYEWAANIVNPFGTNFSTAGIATTFAYDDFNPGQSSRVNNSAYYYSPRIYGFQAAIGYSFQSNADAEVPEAGKNSRLLDTALRYENGPLRAVVVYSQQESPLPGTKVFRNIVAGATYDFRIAAIYAGYSRAVNITTPNGYNGVVATLGRPFSNDNAYTAGVSVPLGPGKVYGAYQRAISSDVDGWSLGYTYGLSKRTDLYAFYSDNDVHNFDQNRDMAYRQFALGLQHRF